MNTKIIYAQIQAYHKIITAYHVLLIIKYLSHTLLNFNPLLRSIIVACRKATSVYYERL